MRYLMLLSGTNPSASPPPELFEAIMKLGGEATQAIEAVWRTESPRRCGPG